MKRLILLFIVLLFLSSTSRSDTYFSAYSNAITVSVTAGDFIVVTRSGSTTVPRTTISDTDTNSYVIVNSTGGSPSGGLVNAVMWYVFAKNTNAALGITTETGNDPGVSLHNYGNTIDTTTPLNVSLVGIENSATVNHTSTGLSVTASSAVIVALWAQELASDNPFTGTSGWTLRTHVDAHVHLTLDKPFSSNGTYTATFTGNGSQAYVYIVAAFNRKYTGTSSPPPPLSTGAGQARR